MHPDPETNSTTPAATWQDVNPWRLVLLCLSSAVVKLSLVTSHPVVVDGTEWSLVELRILTINLATNR